MQKDFDFYDRQSILFQYVILEKLPDNSPEFYIHAIEQQYIDRYAKTVQLYNIGTPSKRSGMYYITMKMLLLKEKIINLFSEK
jgi:hypothetical protein